MFNPKTATINFGDHQYHHSNEEFLTLIVSGVWRPHNHDFSLLIMNIQMVQKAKSIS